MSVAVLLLVASSLVFPFVSGSSELWCARLPAAEKLPWLVGICGSTVRGLSYDLV